MEGFRLPGAEEDERGCRPVSLVITLLSLLLRLLVELEVDLELSEEDEADEDDDELLEADPDSDPLESEPESLDLDLRRDWRGWPAEAKDEPAATEACDNLVLSLRSLLAEDLTECPFSLLLLVLLHVDRGLLAAALSLFRYTLEDLTADSVREEAVKTPEDARGDIGASFQLPLLLEGRPPALVP